MAAVINDHHEHFTEGLVTRAEAILKLLDRPGPRGPWLGPMPAAYVDLGSLEPLYAAVGGQLRRPAAGDPARRSSSD